MEKLTENFYLIKKKGKKWNKEQEKILRDNCHYSMFKPIPKNYVDYILYGFFTLSGKCEYKAPDVVMLNFDVKNGERSSLRGLICISFDGLEKIGKKGNGNYKEYKYLYTDLIGNNSVSNSIAKRVKKYNIIVKSGRDMLKY